jgi:hypothetical protein
MALPLRNGVLGSSRHRHITAEETAKLVTRVDEPDFLACGFAFIGAWGRRAADRTSDSGH